jgi:hypothetical protein
VLNFAVAPEYSAAAMRVGITADKLYQLGSDSEASAWGIPNFPISPGDEVSVEIFPADQFGNTWFAGDDRGGLTAQGNNVWFMVYNYTRGVSYWSTLPCGEFAGATAEFIVEGPQ